jgi:hypothetical protein
MSSPEEALELTITPRPTEAIALSIPVDTLASLRVVAAQKQMSLEGLLKFYIGRCLRADLTQLRAGQTLEAAQQVLSEYLQSEAAAAALVATIRQRSGWSQDDS